MSDACLTGTKTKLSDNRRSRRSEKKTTDKPPKNCEREMVS